MIRQWSRTLTNERNRPMSKANKRPVHEIYVNGPKIAIWRNEDKNGTPRHGVTLARSYRNKDGGWKSTDRFDERDLQNLRKAIDEAHDWIRAQCDAENTPDTDEDDDN